MQPDRRPAWGLPPQQKRPDEVHSEREQAGADRAGESPPWQEGSWPPPPSPSGGWGPPPSPTRRAFDSARPYAFGVVVLMSVAVLLLLLYFTWSATDSDSEDLSRLIQELEAGGTQQANPPPFASTSEPAPQSQSSDATLSVLSDPDGAVVLLDADTLGLTPLRRHPVESGVYFLSVRKAQYESRDTVLYLGEGQSVNLLMPLSSSASGSAPPPSLPSRTDVAPAPEIARPSEARQTSEVATFPEDDAFEENEALGGELFEGEDEEAAPPEPGQLLITSEPARADVWIDGQRVGVTPFLHRDVQPGSHTVMLSRDGYAPFTTSVELKPGQRIVSVSGRLEESFGTLTVLVRPWGSIYIDGKLHRRNADAEYNVRIHAGSHRVKAVHPTLGTWESTINVEPGEARRVEISLPASAASQ